MNKTKLIELIETFVEQKSAETIELVKRITEIPAPSNDELRRAEFVKSWFSEIGVDNAYIDDALNVVCPFNDNGSNEVVIIMAHSDTVFPDTTTITVTERDGFLHAPGVGDNSANLANMLMSVKFILENNLMPQDNLGVIFAATSGEEGLGNLKGSLALCKKYNNRIREVIGIDSNIGSITDNAVGSHRYKVSVYTEGGHSYGDFGNRNAIHYLASMIQTLYMIKAPVKAKTTFNVGTIEGGTSINSIAENASMLYEFRSSDHECLTIMEEYFDSVVAAYNKAGNKVEVETLGIRPCKQGVDEARLEELRQRSKNIITEYFDGEISFSAGSTDSNIPLSMGIPSVTYGTKVSAGTHTRAEHLDISSLIPGQKIAIATALQYFV
jgi:acetylornithine deacetylase/succinyl-diaminopimelate desuccinylase-like protein